MIITVTKFNMTVGEWECSLKTPSRDVDVVVVLRRSLFFPPYYARRIWRANKDCHIEVWDLRVYHSKNKFLPLVGPSGIYKSSKPVLTKYFL